MGRGGLDQAEEALLVEKETVSADEFQQILNDTGVKIGEYGIYA